MLSRTEAAVDMNVCHCFQEIHRFNVKNICSEFAGETVALRESASLPCEFLGIFRGSFGFSLTGPWGRPSGLFWVFGGPLGSS